MKIVCDISEKDYNNIEPFLNGKTINGGFNLFKVLEIIKNGKPLPEYHGRLIDADCISREAVKEMLTEEWTKYMPMESDVNLSFVLEKISELPSVTPKVKTGKWIEYCYQNFSCSKCGYVDTDIDEYKYCPKCGTRMEGIENGRTEK